MTEHSPRQAALVAGVSILIMTVAAVLATDLSIGRLYVPGDASATSANIQSSQLLFRIGIFSWFIILICDVLAAWGLYEFLKPVNRSLSLIMAWFRLVYAAILGAAMLNLTDVLLLTGGDSFSVMPPAEMIQAQVLLSIHAFYEAWSLGLVVFGVHVFFLGYLTYRSGTVPKILGVLLIIAFFGYLITNLADILIPGYKDYKMIVGLIFLIPMLSEVALGIWLVIKGGKRSGQAA